MRDEAGSGGTMIGRREQTGNRLRRWLPLIVIVALSLGAYLSGIHRYLSFQSLLDSREQLRVWVTNHHLATLALFMLTYAAFVALSLPGALLLTLMAGFLFGAVLGGIVTVIAATVGATLIFLAARSSFGEGLRGRAGPWLEKFRKGFQEDATSYLLFLRLVPAFPFWLVNLAPALLGVDARTFVWTTFVGIMPGTFAYAFAGAGLDSIALAHKTAVDACLAAGGTACDMPIRASQLVTREVIFAFAALGLVALVPVLIKHLRRRKAA